MQPPRVLAHQSCECRPGSIDVCCGSKGTHQWDLLKASYNLGAREPFAGCAEDVGLCQTFAKVFSKVAVVRRKAKKSKKVATFLGGRAKVAGGARAEGYKFVRARKFLRF